ncbi:MAG TPA: hypothetical protein VM124_03435 [Candidatus Limnocylindrales bacterium]|nr:hypothetical protein [Candidatus Limnocylindrales bacterium]
MSVLTPEKYVDQLVLPGMVGFERLDSEAQSLLQGATFAVSQLRHIDQETQKLSSSVPFDSLDWYDQLQVLSRDPTYICADLALGGYVKARVLAESLKDPAWLREAVIDLGDSPFVPANKRPLNVEPPTQPYNFWPYGSYVQEIMGGITEVADRQLLETMRRYNGRSQTRDLSAEVARYPDMRSFAPASKFSVYYTPALVSRYNGREQWMVGAVDANVRFDLPDPRAQFEVSASWRPAASIYDPEEMSWLVSRVDGNKPNVTTTEWITRHRYLVRPETHIYWLRETVDRKAQAMDVAMMGRIVSDRGEVKSIARRPWDNEAEILERQFYPKVDWLHLDTTRVEIV